MSAETPPTQCPDVLDRGKWSKRCSLPAGHEGMHKVPGLAWSDPEPPDPPASPDVARVIERVTNEIFESVADSTLNHTTVKAWLRRRLETFLAIASADALTALQAENAQLKRDAECPSLLCPFEKRAEQAEADVASLRRQLEKQWRCFHCGDVFTDEAEAREHFGADYDVDPACAIKADEGGLVGEIRRLEAEVLRVCGERNEYENDARLWHESEADRIRRIGHCQWWQEMDSREGEKLVLQAEVEALRQAQGRLVEELRYARLEHKGCRWASWGDNRCAWCVRVDASLASVDPFPPQEDQ